MLSESRSATDLKLEVIVSFSAKSNNCLWSWETYLYLQLTTFM